MRKFGQLLCLLLALCLASCSTDTGSGVMLSTFLWMSFIIIVTAIVGIGLNNMKKEDDIKNKAHSNSLVPKSFLDLGSYVGGHPDIDNVIDSIKAKKNGQDVILSEWSYNDNNTKPLSSIKLQDINDITIEDATTIENDVTAARLLLVGVFALAWKKRKTNEMAFLRIKWINGKFKNDTLFCFRGEGATQKANIARNTLIKWCSADNDCDDSNSNDDSKSQTISKELIIEAQMDKEKNNKKSLVFTISAIAIAVLLIIAYILTRQ